MFREARDVEADAAAIAAHAAPDFLADLADRANSYRERAVERLASAPELAGHLRRQQGSAA